MIEITSFSGQKKIIEVSELVFRPSVYAVIVDRGEVLLVKNKKTGKLSFPGGAIEKGELIESALKRELKEEIDADELEIGELLAVEENLFYYDPAQEKLHCILIFFKTRVARTAIGSGTDNEEGDPAWYRIDSLCANDLQFLGQRMLDVIKKAAQ